MTTIKTTVHLFKFDTSNDKQRKAWGDFRRELEETRHRFHAWGDSNHFDFEDGQEIELETKCVFGDQWNTACGKRVFDFNDPVFHNSHLHSGYYLDVTPEMLEVRRNTLKCGYCGKHYQAAQGYVFCEACLDSAYLKETELHLLRLKNCEYRKNTSEPLTEAERAHLLPLYVERQTTGADSRAVQAKKNIRAGVEREYKQKTEDARNRYDGLIWLLDHDVNINNVIYYGHTGRFGFGWRTPVSADVKSALLDILCEFPFDYDIKEEATA